jgi:hypothetical protein
VKYICNKKKHHIHPSKTTTANINYNNSIPDFFFPHTHTTTPFLPSPPKKKTFSIQCSKVYIFIHSHLCVRKTTTNKPHKQKKKTPNVYRFNNHNQPPPSNTYMVQRTIFFFLLFFFMPFVLLDDHHHVHLFLFLFLVDQHLYDEVVLPLLESWYKYVVLLPWNIF